jgi:hypothetical protein
VIFRNRIQFLRYQYYLVIIMISEKIMIIIR